MVDMAVDGICNLRKDVVLELVVAGGSLSAMQLATTEPVVISEADFETMLRFARCMHQLKFRPEYLAALDAELPATARIDPGMPSVLMGYDFHLTGAGPKLIEINNNAGGLYVKSETWIPQPDHPALAGSLEERLLGMFPSSWQHIAIMDEDIEKQFMFPEMKAYQELLENAGRTVLVVSPEDVRLGTDGLNVEGVHLDAIYNRHTDFYLESDALAHIRSAYENGAIQLSPNPRSYALLGDKTRMADWWRPGLLDGIVFADELSLIRSVVPEAHRLSEMDRGQAWSTRNNWVFKPAARHGGKGVLLGKSVSRTRFDAMPDAETVVQQFVPASHIEIGGELFKFDMRLFMHGENLIAVAGRAWQGQVTNFRSEGSGWVPVAVR